MTTIGLLGGMSWDSSATYYRVVNERVRAERGGHACADLVLVSLDFAQVRELQVLGDWAAAGELLADAARRAVAAGAGTVLVCTNLMHRVADAVQAAVDVPLLHIADAVGAELAARGVRRTGLLGARSVMEDTFYRDRLSSWGIEVVVPGAEDRTTVDRVVFEELTRGLVQDASRAAYADVVARLADAGAEAVVLGCTEIGLLLTPGTACLPLVDSALVHAAAAADVALGRRPAAWRTDTHFAATTPGA